MPVHPTQLYEALGLGVLGWVLLRWRRQRVDDTVVLGRYLVVAGALRFVVEFIRVNTRVLWGLSDATTDLARARDLMQQFGIAGEIQWPATHPLDGSFAFQVSRPGAVIDLKADLRSGRATLQRTDVNAWGVMHVLHTFSGMPSAGPRNERDWILTTVWAISMDAVAAGLIFMVFSSYIMWSRLKAKRLGGIIALVLGLASCGAFVAALGWPM